MQDYSKLAKQPTKRSRKYNRQRKQPSFPLLSLPLELVHAVLDLVTDVDDLEALSWTCRSFYNRCRKRALLKRFAPDRIFKSLDIGLDGVLPATLYCLADAEAVDVGFKPFTIIDTIEWNGDVFLRVLEHDCTRFEEHLHTRSYLNIEWTDDRVWLAHNCVICNVVDPDDMLILTWDDEFSGSLQKMTSAMMHERFTCPECMDSQVVECGDDGFRAR